MLKPARLKSAWCYDGNTMSRGKGSRSWPAYLDLGISEILAGDVSVGPVATTRMACPGPEMVAEERFLEQLQGVVQFGFLGGRLALTYTVDSVPSVMLFDRSQP